MEKSNPAHNLSPWHLASPDGSGAAKCYTMDRYSHKGMMKWQHNGHG